MSKLKIVKGNTFDTVVEIRAYKYNGEEITDFDLNNCTNLIINSRVSNESYRINNYQILDDKHIQIRWDGKKTKIGDYSLEVTGKLGNDDWRFYDKSPIFAIVNTNSEANIPKQSIIREDCYYVDKQRVYIVAPKGDPGDVGPQGPVGPLGPKGETGATGPQGAAFTYSDFTPALLEALRGPLGETGLTGQLGAAFTYADFTQELLAALKGEPGTDGHSPEITALKSGDTTTIYLDGTSIATINDGQDGTNGVSPTISVSLIQGGGGHTVSITDALGTSSFNVMDGSLANQILSNWEETNTSSASYIQNKPSLFSGNYNDLSNKPTIPSEVTEQTVSGWGFTKNTGTSTFSGSYNDLTDKPTIPSLSGYATEQWVGQQGYLTSFTEQDPTVPSWAKVSSKPSYSYSEISNTPSLATVATTGAYSDLTGTPTIPTVPSNESASSGGSTLSVVTTGEKYTWNNKASIWSGTQALYTALSPNYDSNTVYIITAS